MAGTDEHFKTGQALSADGGNTASPNREGITISSCGDDRRDALPSFDAYADATQLHYIRNIRRLKYSSKSLMEFVTAIVAKNVKTILLINANSFGYALMLFIEKTRIFDHSGQKMGELSIGI
ncbi:MAG TPA: hypothetical protein PKI97_09115 [Smithellaceae bacterium]|nr:hypothetical protein [Smithellaceae bacterium]